jgi:PAS domain S-box-containing protein
MQLTLEHKVTLGFLAALGLLLFSGSAAWFSASRTTERTAWVDQTHRVLYQLEAVLTDLLNMQTSVRGFLLTGEERFLEPYQAGRTRIQESLPRLSALTADNPMQRDQMRDLIEATGRLMELMHERIEDRRHAGFEAATETAALHEGKAAMDRIRHLVAAMQTHERKRLAARSEDARLEARRTFWTTAVGGTVAVLVVGLAALWVRHDLRARLEAEAERDRFFNLSLDLLCVADAGGYFKRVNPAFTRVLGWSEQELLARPFLDFVHPDDHAATLGEVDRQVKAGQPVLHFENRYRHKDGSWRTLSWRSTPQGGLMYATARDVTEEQAAAAALRRASAEIQDLYNRAPCGYHSLDGEGRFVAINDTELEWLGYTRDEVVGKLRFRDLLTPTGREVFTRNFPKLLATGRVDDLEFELCRKNGTTFFASLSATAVRDADGNFLHSRSTLHDVTARHAAEQQLARLNAALQENAARLEAANRELEAFSYSVSHDLRAPLRHIDGFASLLQKNAAAQLDPTARRHLDFISGAARQMGRLIDDLLSFSRMGRAALQPTRVDQSALVAAIVREGRYAQTHPALTWRIDPLPAAHGDPAMLRQVWANLIDNAVKYSAKTPRPRIEISAYPAGSDNRETVYFVRDNGAGFDPRYIDKLFGVFQRLHTAAEFEGTGIGLANVRRIIARHGGRTWAEGRPGGGATFYFSLPASPASSQETGIPPRDTPLAPPIPA